MLRTLDKMKVLLFLVIVSLVKGDKVVNTRSGPVRGISLSPGKKVEAFLGIPYAEPPVRFAKPVPKSPWEEIYEANHLPPTCTQLFLEFFPALIPDKRMSEDCLHLNLWVPEGGSDSKSIMLFIHGGGYLMGSSNLKIYDGSTLAEHGDVIVASINYRVGTLGFFYGLSEEAAGNMGLYDQILAMQWIKENAESFGGDPENIVLFGESAGAFSVSLHMVSPLSRNLFRRAILQSGSSFGPMFSKDNGLLEMCQDIAIQLGCAEGSDSLKKDSKKVVDCMKSLPAKKFQEVDFSMLQRGILMVPRVGDEFLPENAFELFNNGNFKDSELLLGVTRDEGSMFVSIHMADKLGVLGEKRDTISLNEARQYLEIPSQPGYGEKGKLLEDYLNRVKADPKYTYLSALSDFEGDFLLACGVYFQAEYHSLKGNPVYFYRFEYRPDSSPYAEWMGVLHFDEVQYVFGNPANKDFTEIEKELSSDIMDMWIAFAKTGNPSIPGGVKYPLFTYQDPKFMVLSKNDKVGIRPDDRRCEPWREVFHSIIDEDTIQRLKNA